MFFFKTGKKQGHIYVRVKQLPAGGLSSCWPKTGNAPCRGREVGSPHLSSSQIAAPTNSPGVRPCSCLWLVKCCPSPGFITSLSSCFKWGARGRLATPEVGYAEAASRQALAVCHGAWSPECSWHIKDIEEPCHSCCAKVKVFICKCFTLDNKILFLKH